MDSRLNIPWEAAKKLAEDYQQDFVVALLWSEKTGTETVLTWGRTLQQSDGAANLGNTLKEKLGWDASDCTTISSKVLELVLATNTLLKCAQNVVEKIYENSLDDHLPVSLPPLEAAINNLKHLDLSWGGKNL